jgi:SAM-dependent methyltransferase
MKQEFDRLISLGWKLPPQNEAGLYFVEAIDENLISFPSASYDSEAINNDASGFWALERANAIVQMLKPLDVKMLWEIGAGNGNVAIPLRKMGIQVIPVEPLESGAITLAKNGFPTFLATLESLNLPKNSLDAVGAFDVLEHLENPTDLLKEVNRILKVGGIFICSVPAYQWLFSDFDISIGHFRRYSKKSLKNLNDSAQLSTIHTNTLFGFLVIPAFLIRRIPYLIGRKRSFVAVQKSTNSRFGFLSRLDFIFIFLVKLEKVFRLGFGLSLLSISKKT